MSLFKTALLYSFFVVSINGNVHAGQLTAAIAANFAGTINDLKPLFEKETGHQLVTSFASTGTLFAQIHNGAPFDIFLSADVQRPHQLIEDRLGVAESLFVYASGELVLWSSRAGLIDPQGHILRNRHWSEKGLRHIALANPKTAPYGKAAVETLQTMQLFDVTKPYHITGQNIAQTFQFVASGNAQLGFIALAQLRALPENERGTYWQIPQEMHSPIQQMAVLLNRGRNNSAAVDFLKFLQSPQAQSIIHARGYR